MSVYAQNDGSLSNGVVVESGTTPAYNITAAATYKAKRVAKVSVIVSAAAASSVNDCAAGAAAVGNQILAIPASAPAGTLYELDWPLNSGLLTITPGAGVTLAVSYDA